ncbi:MAG: adenylate/guanylate cyclase domain-containing protein, partial [Nitrospinota bacterium]
RLSILFADIRGFTSISEGLPAKDVVWILNRYLPEMVEVIFEHKGTVDKFIGDAIMAFWGAPVRDENHALNSVNTAVEMFRRLEGLNLGPFKEKGLPEVRIGIGIHTGTVVLGNIGSEKKLDYTVIGDNVNIASRLEGLTKTYGISVLITEETFMELEGRVPCRIIDLVRVKGRQNPVRIYGLLCTSFDSPEILKEKEMLSARFEEAFACYFNQDWENALLKYTSLKRSIPKDKYILIMIERCQEFLRSGCEDWDGVYKVAGN